MPLQIRKKSTNAIAFVLLTCVIKTVSGTESKEKSDNNPRQNLTSTEQYWDVYKALCDAQSEKSRNTKTSIEIANSLYNHRNLNGDDYIICDVNRKDDGYGCWKSLQNVKEDIARINNDVVKYQRKLKELANKNKQ